MAPEVKTAPETNKTAKPGFRSLRWQLLLSYAAIALLAVLTLGIALLGSLRGYYEEQERAYLARNAATIADEITPLLTTGDDASLQSQIEWFSFLTQTDVQVFDQTGETILASSGRPDSFIPAIPVSSESSGLLDSLGINNTVIVEEEMILADGAISSQRTVTQTNRIPAQGSLYGFELGVEPGSVDERSDLAVKMSIGDTSGTVLGYVRLADGPAYGKEILRSVAWGWAAAGTAAVVLAALIGWLVSRRLTRPLEALTVVTGRMADGEFNARAHISRDDEIGLLGHSFNQMADQVESTVTSLRRFTADAAHELHTPLTALQTDLQLLAAGVDGPQKRRVARAEEQALRLQDLVESLLELSQLEARTIGGPLPPVDLAEIVQTTGELYASRAEQVGLAFELALPGERPLPVYADKKELQRALANVLDNCLKFTESPGEISLSLSVDGDSAVVIARDSGIGIPEDDVAQLFNRFHRGRNAAGYAGSGLGLAIVQEIMKRNQGQIVVSSGEWGTEVKLSLPLLTSLLPH